MRKAEEIKKDVVNQLAWDSRVDASNISVKVEDNEVSLSGTVPFFSEKDNAENIAWAVDGVYSIDNELNVKFPPTFKTPQDDQIEDTVEQFLKWNTTVDESSVSIDVDDGEVTLEGSVPTFWEKLEAEREAQIVRGVKDVKSKIVVAPTEKVGDEILGERVMDRVEQNTLVDVDKVDVKVKDGKVTLSGVVPSWYIWDSVYDAAKNTIGITEIEDKLKIKPS
jgi:osmotically-inducible protein OsmY